MAPLPEFMTAKNEVPSSNPIEKKVGIVTEWVNKRCRTEGTKRAYYNSLLRFLKAIYGEKTYPNFTPGGSLKPSERQRRINKRHKIINDGIQRYFNEDRNFLEDFNNFILWMNKEKYAPQSIHTTSSLTKKFFSRHDRKLTDEEWEDLHVLLAPNKPRTQDKTLTKEQMRTVLNHLGLGMRSVILFLASTGARVGETLQLKVTDINLDLDPPRVTIRNEYTKKEVGGRVVCCSYEARDAIREWLKAKVDRKKKTGKSFSRDLVFGTSEGTIRVMWHKALMKAGLDQRDPSTKNKVYVYHIHTLRKFFNSQLIMDGVHDNIIQAWMGHSKYLAESYDRFNEEQLAKIYRDHMESVSVYGTGSISEFRKKLEAIEEEAKHDKEEIQKVNEMLDKMGIPNDRPLEDRLLIGFQELAKIKQEAPKEKFNEELEKKRRLEAALKQVSSEEHKRDQTDRLSDVKDAPSSNTKVEPCYWCKKPSVEKWRFKRDGRVFSFCRMHVKSIEDSEKWEKVNSNL